MLKYAVAFIEKIVFFVQCIVLEDKYLGQVNKWNKVFKIGPSKICGRQSLKNLKG